MILTSGLKLCCCPAQLVGSVGDPMGCTGRLGSDDQLCRGDLDPQPIPRHLVCSALWGSGQGSSLESVAGINYRFSCQGPLKDCLLSAGDDMKIRHIASMQASRVCGLRVPEQMCNPRHAVGSSHSVLCSGLRCPKLSHKDSSHLSQQLRVPRQAPLVDTGRVAEEPLDGVEYGRCA